MRYAIENILSIHAMTRAGSRPSHLSHDPRCVLRRSWVRHVIDFLPTLFTIICLNPFGVSRFEKCYRLSRARLPLPLAASHRPAGLQMAGLSLGSSYRLLAPRSPLPTSGEENYATSIRCITFERSIVIAGWTHSVLELLTVGYS